MSGSEPTRRRRKTEAFGSQLFEPFQILSLAGGLDRSNRRSATDSGKWWDAEGFATDRLSVVKAGGIEPRITALPLSNILQGHFERGAFYMMGSESGGATFAYYDPNGFDLFGIMRNSGSPTEWLNEFDVKLSRDPESAWTPVNAVGRIYRIVFTAPPVATPFEEGEDVSVAASWIGRVVKQDAETGELWVAKTFGATGSDPAAAQTVVGADSGASEVIDTAADTGFVFVHFSAPGYPSREFGSATATTSAGAYPRMRVMWRRGATSRHATQDVYAHETAPVQALHRYVHTDGAKHLVASTCYQAYLSDGLSPVDETDCINPSYRVGTAANAGAAVTGTGTTWTDTDWPGPVSDDWLFKYDADAHTHWTPVLSRNSDTSLTLRWAYPRNAGVAEAYTLRRRWQNIVPPTQARLNKMIALNWLHALPERAVVLLNGVDPPMKWAPGIAAVGNAAVGETQPIDTSDLGTPIDWARCGVVFKEHLLLGHYKQGADVFDRGFIWSDPRNMEAWQPLNRRDLDFPDTLEWLHVFGDTVVAFGKKNAMVLRYLGAPFYFGIQQRLNGVGCIAPGSVQNSRDQTLLFLGPDDLWSFDGFRPERIGAPIRDILFPLLNHTNLPYVSSCYDDTTSEYRLSVPLSNDDLRNHATFVFNTRERTWTRPYGGFTAFGDFESSDDEGVVDDDERIVETVEDLVDARVEETPLALAGAFDGSIFRLTGLTEDGADVVSRLETGLSDFGIPNVKRVGWITIEGQSTYPVTFYLLISMDGRRVARAGPFTANLDEPPEPGRQRAFDGRFWVNRRAKFFGLEFLHDRSDDDVAIDSAVLWYKPVGMR